MTNSATDADLVHEQSSVQPIRWDEPKYSSERRQRRVTIEGALTSGVTIRLTGSADAVAAAARHFTENTSAATRLADSFVNALHRSARTIPRAVDRAWRTGINEVAAAVYLYVRKHYGGSGNIAALLRRAEKQCAARVPQWAAYSQPDRRIMLTAFLVHFAHRREWEVRALTDPVSAPDSFYAHYIKPGLPHVNASLRHPATQQFF